jgi:hypothetical protein
MIDAQNVRASFGTALEADLADPFHPDAVADPQDELLTLPPPRWYVTGFLAPQSDRETTDPVADERFSGPEEDEDETTSVAEPEPKQKTHFPASMCLSVFRPKAPTEGTDRLRATVTFEDYVREQPAGGGKNSYIGLTTTYNRLKDPANQEPRILELRRLHEEMDRALLDAYGWNDIEVPPYCPLGDDDKKQLARFEDAVIDRLFVLNAQRAEEEKRKGLAAGAK